MLPRHVPSALDTTQYTLTFLSVFELRPFTFFCAFVHRESKNTPDEFLPRDARSASAVLLS